MMVKHVGGRDELQRREMKELIRKAKLRNNEHGMSMCCFMSSLALA